MNASHSLFIQLVFHINDQKADIYLFFANRMCYLPKQCAPVKSSLDHFINIRTRGGKGFSKSPKQGARCSRYSTGYSVKHQGYPCTEIIIKLFSEICVELNILLCIWQPYSKAPIHNSSFFSKQADFPLLDIYSYFLSYKPYIRKSRWGEWPLGAYQGDFCFR